MTKPTNRKLPDTQEEEMELAHVEGRQPICIYCEHPINTIRQTQYDNIRWKWDAKAKKYRKDQDGTSDPAYHSCEQCSCEASDWNFVDEVLVEY